MDSKEWIKGVLYNLEEALDNAKETKNKDLEIDCKMQKEAYNQVLKDLDELEEYREIMGTPIREIMKKLKVLEKQDKILEIFKENLYTLDEDICMTRIFASEKENKIIKEWLDDK